MALNGNKTYVIAMGLIAYSIGGVIAGKLDMVVAIEQIFLALGMMGLRHGIEKMMVDRKLDIPNQTTP